MLLSSWPITGLLAAAQTAPGIGMLGVVSTR